MIDLSNQALEELLGLCRTVTPGPWISFIEGRDHSSGSSFIRTAVEDIELSGATAADQDFIAQSRQYLPALIAEVLRLRSAP